MRYMVPITKTYFAVGFRGDSPKWNFEILGKNAFFNEENTNEFDPMLKSGKIHFFSIWTATTSFGATKVIDTLKKTVFFLNFQNF